MLKLENELFIEYEILAQYIYAESYNYLASSMCFFNCRLSKTQNDKYQSMKKSFDRYLTMTQFL